MQYSHDYLCGGPALLCDNAGWYSPAVIGNCYRIVGMYYDLYVCAETSKRFIDGIIDSFKHHMVKAGTIVGVADIHAGTFTDSIKPFEDLNAMRIV